MCGGGGSPAPVTPAAAPAPPEPAPIETSLTDARRKQSEDLYGTGDGSADTRYRSEGGTGATVGGTSTRKSRNSKTKTTGNAGLRM
jgi:hypothetical protein